MHSLWPFHFLRSNRVRLVVTSKPTLAFVFWLALSCAPSDRGNKVEETKVKDAAAGQASDLTDAEVSDGADAAHSDASIPYDAGMTGGLDAGGTPGPATHVARPLGTMKAPNGYWEYLPPGYGDGVPRPLIVFWHGIGENGSGSVADLQKVPNNGPPKLIKEGRWPESRPFVVLSPQHSGDLCAKASEIHDFLEFAINSYKVDKSRVYLSGVSCGAIGAAQYLADYEGEQVVAAVLVAGMADIAYQGAGCALVSQVALWSLHGAMDGVVEPASDNMGMKSFAECPAPRKDVKYTLYPGVGHDAWTQTYDLSAGHDVYAWLLNQKR